MVAVATITRSKTTQQRPVEIIMKLSVHLITWNGARYAPFLFDSLRNQTYKDWTLLVVDNNSQDGMVEAMKRELSDFPVQWKIIENRENRGFAGGHNQAFREADSEYFLLLNQDMYLMPDCFEKMVKFLDANQQAAAVSPRLMRWNFVEAVNNLQKSFTDQIDALGLKVFRNRRVVEQFTQQNWSGDLKNKFPGKEMEVFGVSGALPMYRRSAMNQILFAGGQMFDESYHSYKEDVDLAYRLCAHGDKAFVLLNAIAYHDRSGEGTKEMADVAAAENKKKQSEWVKYHSYKNHLATLYKNEYWQNLILDFPWILWYEFKKLVYFLLFGRKILRGLKELNFRDWKAKRKYIQNQKKINWKEMRKWWSL